MKTYVFIVDHRPHNGYLEAWSGTTPKAMEILAANVAILDMLRFAETDNSILDHAHELLKKACEGDYTGTLKAYQRILESRSEDTLETEPRVGLHYDQKAALRMLQASMQQLFEAAEELTHG